MHGLLPDAVGAPGSPPASEATATSAASKPPGDVARAAAITTAVVFPVMFWFYLFEWLGGVLILVFVALLSIQPGFAGSFKAGKALIVGNVIGGTVAVIFYELLVMVPLFHFMLLLTLLLGLLFCL